MSITLKLILMKIRPQALGLILAASAFLWSCNSEMNGEHQTEETDPMLLNVSPATPGAASQAQSASVGVQPAGAGNAPGASTQAAKTSAMINPPHGEPGHDCAVAVGAPLPNASGAPASPDVQPLEGQSPVVETKIVPNPDQPAIRMNPPHGQPGHDCAVAVGAPLP